MIFVQIATALAVGAYVALSKDAHAKRPNATPRLRYALGTLTDGLYYLERLYHSEPVNVQRAGKLRVMTQWRSIR